MIEHGKLIGRFRNEWRGRDVLIYDHPSDPTLVVTRGICYRVAAEPVGMEGDIWTTEPRERFAYYIGTYDKVYH